jgi:carbonic anhydrase
VTAVTANIQGRGHTLERNIPPLIENIEPAVKRAMAKQPTVKGDAIIPYAIEENVWQSIEDLFMKSPATRELVKSGVVKVVGAIYDVSTGVISYLPSQEVDRILKTVEASPKKAEKPQAH